VLPGQAVQIVPVVHAVLALHLPLQIALLAAVALLLSHDFAEKFWAEPV
jgi:hypothetical protein